MDLDDAILVDMVRQYSVLYDKSHKDFEDRNIKENAWKTISSALYVDVNVAQARWTVLRTKYGVEKKNYKKMPSGSGAKKTWPLLSSMAFLDKHMTMRKTTGNISAPDKQSQPSSSNSNSQSPWSSLSMIIGDNIDCMEGSRKGCSSSQQSSELSDSEIQLPEETDDVADKENLDETILTEQSQRRVFTEYKNETPPLKKKRKKAEEANVMMKLSSTFDNFNEYLKTKSCAKNMVRDMVDVEHESVMSFMTSIGNDLLLIKNKRIRYSAKKEILNIVQQARCNDASENESENE
ncbi:unnamed protein product [Phaedon cochleariae]|uniref:MADF domain-containing protein n=1 Tax=Phaedon cochleariae TaxID=80249 RepID=A0A9P0DUU5_PHACE|nr:unnamed protein product [Phaedon cochleariae]